MAHIASSQEIKLQHSFKSQYQYDGYLRRVCCWFSCVKIQWVTFLLDHVGWSKYVSPHFKQQIGALFGANVLTYFSFFGAHIFLSL